MGLFGKVLGGLTGKPQAKAIKRASEREAQAIERAYKTQQREVPRAIATLKRGVSQAERLRDPYAARGAEALAAMQGLIGRPAQFVEPTAAEVAESPAVRFRMQQAQRALERGAAARGGLFGGGHQRQLAQYMQGLASQEYEQEFQRRLRAAQFRGRGLEAMARIGLQPAMETAAGRARFTT